MFRGANGLLTGIGSTASIVADPHRALWEGNLDALSIKGISTKIIHTLNRSYCWLSTFSPFQFGNHRLVNASALNSFKSEKIVAEISATESSISITIIFDAI